MNLEEWCILEVNVGDILQGMNSTLKVSRGAVEHKGESVFGCERISFCYEG